MQIQENISLKPYNTFGIQVNAKQFAIFSTLADLEELLHGLAPSGQPKHQLLILGGGSNVLFTGNFNGLVLKNNLLGIELVKEDSQFYYVKAGAGENWHGLVMHCINNGYAGLENLSLIPGCAGASPMQNIGAYGVEIKDVFECLEAYHIQDKTTVQFNLADCRFAYRESVFKSTYKGQFIILSVTFKLRKQPVYHTSYGAIEQELEKMGVQTLDIKAISQAVINIRSSKLPNPANIGNAGSFFKNPQIPAGQYDLLKQQYPNIPGYPAEEAFVKVAAGWLIEQCGWKGYRQGDAGVHAKQALVLVNYGNATGTEIYGLSTKIISSVEEKFGIALEREVNVY